MNGIDHMGNPVSAMRIDFSNVEVKIEPRLKAVLKKELTFHVKDKDLCFDEYLEISYIKTLNEAYDIVHRWNNNKQYNGRFRLGKWSVYKLIDKNGTHFRVR